MAGENDKLTLSFRGAPLLLCLALQSSSSQTTVAWPKTAAWAQFDLTDPDLNKEIKDQLAWLKRSYETIGKNASSRQLAPHILPYLAKTDITLNVKKQNLIGLASRINTLPLAYARTVAQSLSDSMQVKGGKLPAIEPGGALINDRNRVRLIEARPTNELEIGLDDYVIHSGLSWAAGMAAWLDAPYEQKQAFWAVGIHNALSRFEYRLELVGEPGRLLSLASQGYYQIEFIQPPVPGHGYELPPKLSDGGLMQRCFDISAELYAQVQAVRPELAQLFVLWGHRQRAVVSVDHRNLRKIARSKNGYIKLIRDKLAEKHPSLWKESGQLG